MQRCINTDEYPEGYDTSYFDEKYEERFDLVYKDADDHLKGLLYPVIREDGTKSLPFWPSPKYNPYCSKWGTEEDNLYKLYYDYKGKSYVDIYEFDYNKKVWIFNRREETWRIVY